MTQLRENCGMLTSKCEHGKFVPDREIRVGLKVAKKFNTLHHGSSRDSYARFAFPLPTCTGQATITNIKSTKTFGDMTLIEKVDITCVGHNQVLVNYCNMITYI